MEDAEPTQQKTIRLPKKAEKVKNKAPASLQITAEQLLREAKERELELAVPPPRVKITDPDELAEFNRKKRKEFEDNIRKNRLNIPNWIKYAKWEESIGEVQRARSVFERTLDVEHRNISVYLQYAEMEMRNKQVNHARNIWNRAVTILPMASQFWLKYSYMEELIENIPGARQVFERWMDCDPDERAWQTYINFEVRYKEIDRARNIYQRFINAHPDYKNWIRYAKFEERHDFIGNARAVYEQALEYFDDHLNQNLLIAFAQFEERQREFERSRIIYQYGIDRLPTNASADLFKCLTLHEKKFGELVRIENVIVSKRKRQYEQQLEENPYNYDVWFDYIRLLTNEDVKRTEVEDVFERAISNIPPYMEKRFWRRYIWLWIYYAVYEELDVGDVEKCRSVYTACLDIIPNKQFTFAKVWIMFAQFELRQLELGHARKIMGVAIGKCPKRKLFTEYIEMELELREFDRCRTLYQQYLNFAPDNSLAWIRFAELENALDDAERARAIFEIAVEQPSLDMPEILWKAYIDFEIEQEDYKRVRILYDSLLQRTQHIKVWISWAELEVGTGDVAAARGVYCRANAALERSPAEERLVLLEKWRDFENEHGDETSRREVEKFMPRKVKKRRQITTEDGTDAGWEEYYDYIFPQDQTSKLTTNLLERAMAWKKRMAAASGGASVEPTDATESGVLERDRGPAEEDEEDVDWKRRKLDDADANDSGTDLSESTSSSSQSSDDEDDRKHGDKNGDS